MTGSIYKFGVPLTRVAHVQMPQGAVLLHVAEQGAAICVWARVNTPAPSVLRWLHVVGTGSDLPIQAAYVGTVVMSSGFVWHIFDGGEV